MKQPVPIQLRGFPDETRDKKINAQRLKTIHPSSSCSSRPFIEEKRFVGAG